MTDPSELLSGGPDRGRRPLVGPRLSERQPRSGARGGLRGVLGRVVGAVRARGYRRTIPVFVVCALVLVVGGAFFLVTRTPSAAADEPRLIVTSVSASGGGGTAAVDSGRAGAPFVVRLIGDASGSLSITLQAPCADLPAVDLVVSTGSAGAVPLSSSACAVAADAWTVSELSPDRPVASFTLGAVPVADRTGPAEWRGRLVVSLGTGSDAIAQEVAMSLSGDGSVVVEDVHPPLLPSTTSTDGSTSAGPSASPRPTTTAGSTTSASRPSGGNPSGGSDAGTSSPVPGGASTGGASTGGGSTGGGSTGGEPTSGGSSSSASSPPAATSTPDPPTTSASPDPQLPTAEPTLVAPPTDTSPVLLPVDPGPSDPGA